MHKYCPKNIEYLLCNAQLWRVTGKLNCDFCFMILDSGSVYFRHDVSTV